MIVLKAKQGIHICFHLFYLFFNIKMTFSGCLRIKKSEVGLVFHRIFKFSEYEFSFLFTDFIIPTQI